MKKVHNIIKLIDRRRELRRKSTSQEDLLWRYLRNRGLGVKFKRQHSISGYVLDFYCAEKKLIVELDGKIHNKKEAREYDAVRDKFFKELGYTILRFWNSEVENNIERVLYRIKSYV